MKPLLWTALVLVHSWYPLDCCGDRDCRPVACSEFSADGNGGVMFRGRSVPRHQLRASQDAGCHVCSSQISQVNCVFLPGVT